MYFDIGPFDNALKPIPPSAESASYCSKVSATTLEDGLKSQYAAAWLPLAGQAAAGTDQPAPAVEYVDRQCTEAGKRGILVTHTKTDLATPSLEHFARNHYHATQRSHQDVRPGSGPVLVDMPDLTLLALAHSLANGESLCAVESGALNLNGWAVATRAMNLHTGQTESNPPPAILKLFDDLLWAGNNGWFDSLGKRDAQRLLKIILKASSSYDADFVASYVIGKGKSADAAKQIRAIFLKLTG